MKIFTFTSSNKLQEGAVVSAYTLKNGTVIPVVSIGESGRGRKLSFLPVANAITGDTIYNVSIAHTLKGGLKLNNNNSTDTAEDCILICKTGMGFRGGSSVTVEGGELAPIVLAEGQVADGIAGRMGCSRQYILHLFKDVVLSIKLTGRLYGDPDRYFLRFNGTTVEVITAEEREFVEW